MTAKSSRIALVLLWVGAISGCGSGGAPAGPPIQISNAAFAAGGAIPKDYTEDGKNISPALQWSNVPKAAQELALICDDPDALSAEPWVHWVLYNLPVETKALPEGVPADEKLKDPAGATQGLNDFSKTGYRGPAPPPGKPHHYHFTLYALDSKLNLAPGLTKAKLLEAIKGHVLAQGELVGTYGREK